MIFAVADHIEQIKKGTKTQTRRVAKPNSFFYRVAHTYGVRKCRTCKNLPEGRIRIIKAWFELRQDRISEADAKAEGGYTPEVYEELFEKMHPKWRSRYCYWFRWEATK